MEVRMARSGSQQKAQAAWDRIEALGGHGVWDADVVVVSLANTALTDDDLALFRDFPFVRTLDLSHTGVGDGGLAHLSGLPALEELIVVGTKMSPTALKAFRREHPTVKVTTKPPPKGTVNPFTGEPF
jgi:hypothetical protein